jgi:hypothetical protein
MNKRFVVITLLICLAAFTATIVTTARAQNYLPGVQLGDIYFYTTTSHWTSTDAYASIPPELAAVNQTISTEVRISDVNDTFVTTFTAAYYKDATPLAARGTVNIQTGDTADSGFPAIIAGNLSAGNLIHPAGSDRVKINDTLTMDSRQTNRIYISVYNATTGVTSSIDRYFDRATGMLVQETESTVDGGSISGTTSTTSIAMQLKSSPWNPINVPIPEFPPILALPIFIGATTLIVIALKKKHMIVGTPAIKA